MPCYHAYVHLMWIKTTFTTNQIDCTAFRIDTIIYSQAAFEKIVYQQQSKCDAEWLQIEHEKTYQQTLRINALYPEFRPKTTGSHCLEHNIFTKMASSTLHTSRRGMTELVCKLEEQVATLERENKELKQKYTKVEKKSPKSTQNLKKKYNPLMDNMFHY